MDFFNVNSASHVFFTCQNNVFHGVRYQVKKTSAVSEKENPLVYKKNVVLPACILCTERTKQIALLKNIVVGRLSVAEMVDEKDRVEQVLFSELNNISSLSLSVGEKHNNQLFNLKKMRDCIIACNHPVLNINGSTMDFSYIIDDWSKEGLDKLTFELNEDYLQWVLKNDMFDNLSISESIVCQCISTILKNYHSRQLKCKELESILNKTIMETFQLCAELAQKNSVAVSHKIAIKAFLVEMQSQGFNGYKSLIDFCLDNQCYCSALMFCKKAQRLIAEDATETMVIYNYLVFLHRMMPDQAKYDEHA